MRHRARRGNRSLGHRGYTLIEVVMATSILAVGLVGCAGALVYATKVSTIAQETIVAENLASELLGEARARPYNELANWYTYPGEADTELLEQWCGQRLAQAELAEAQVWFTVTDVQYELKGVSVVITWGMGSPGGVVETETLISPEF